MFRPGVRSWRNVASLPHYAIVSSSLSDRNGNIYHLTLRALHGLNKD